ncbi:unnamed protein product [Schistosoma rodhaini]|uniref:Uncharacterized protein n=1 Tax=Schistosoma rodhaini TaxID=6188 RepID=A0AA85ENC8_9TREM|nr:unnamed protein product [Schistosoma rodhaini]CAH8681052.1 unnamed protein product [Schistosoma rodhaini]
MLLNRYEQFGIIGRPVNDSKIKVDVRYGLQLFQILDLDENKQILRTNCWCMHLVKLFVIFGSQYLSKTRNFILMIGFIVASVLPHEIRTHDRSVSSASA